MSRKEIKEKKKSCENINRFFIGTTLILIILMGCIIKYAYDRNKENDIYKENSYNMAFDELVYYVQSIENWLAKASISSSKKNGMETMAEISKEAELAVSYLSQVPLSTNELTKTAKFLNQLSEYSYSLNRKVTSNEKLSEKDLDNIEMMHDYSVDLKNGLTQMQKDLADGIISWKDISKEKKELSYVQEVDNVESGVISDIDKTFDEYAGLIYDGAFSEHIEKESKKGLIGEEISEKEAEKKVREFFKDKDINNISYIGNIKEGKIDVYKYEIAFNESDVKAMISISKKGGYPILMSYPKEINNSKITKEKADEIGKKFLKNIGFENMKETYYQLDENTITINYAYNQDGVIIYPDLIKLKLSLLDGEVLGIETTGYINCHETRDIKKDKIGISAAKKTLNKNLEIESEGLAIIPTEWKTEILCYEFKGKVNETEFLVYINAQTGEEEKILVIIETEGEILTM